MSVLYSTCKQSFLPKNPNKMPSFSSFQRKAENAAAVSNKSNLVIQPKLTVNTPNDRYEQEADAVADHVMRMPEPSRTPTVSDAPFGVSRLTVSSLQRKCADCEEKEKLQRKETGNDAAGMSAPASVNSTLSSGGGQSLDKGIQQFMESRFNQDFSQVRVHTDGQAATSARDIQARAYTSGNHIVFGKGEYQPHTERGKRLLAHELVHTIQQGQKPSIQRSWFSGRGDCYKRRFSGIYQTLHWYDIKLGYDRIHEGPCTQCEGKTSVGCCEPPDRDCVNDLP